MKFPTNLNDCIAVVKWVSCNKEKFSSANAKIGVSGDSSGGHMSALISHRYPSLIDYQILIYPVFYLGNNLFNHVNYGRIDQKYKYIIFKNLKAIF